MRFVFWISFFLLMYTYFGYPLVLWVITTLRPRHLPKGIHYPAVSIIIAARNEADKIRQKIEHTLALTYPTHLLEVLVASDASDDGTDEIVQEYAPNGVRLARAAQRAGKEYAQGLAIGAAKGDILVFTDAATILETDALTRLVQNFFDPSVAAVSTEDILLDALGNPTAEGLYVKYEMWVRRLESQFHSLVGLSGSCFALRKELCAYWPSGLASDFLGALKAARRGYRSVADSTARGRFLAVGSPELETRRKIRTFLRGIRVLMANLDMLNPFRYGRFAFQLASHKLLRFIAPFLLLTSLAASGFLMGDRFFGLFFWTQVAFYFLGAIGGVIPSLQRNPAIRVAWYFTAVQSAMVVAWGRYMRGYHQVTWEPSKRQPYVAADTAASRPGGDKDGPASRPYRAGA